MSKLETLKSLPTPNDLRETVQQLGRAMDQTARRLDATAAQVQSLEQLPQLVADQVSQSLAPILTMRADVNKVLDYYNEITAAQRSSLEQMAEELGDRATKGMQQKAAALDATIQTLAGQVQGLTSTMDAMKISSNKLQALPKNLTKATTDAAKLMTDEAEILTTEAAKARPIWWLTLGQMLGAAVLGSLLVVVGQAALSRLLPPSETQKQADYAVSLWGKALENERVLLNQIASRPAK